MPQYTLQSHVSDCRVCVLCGDVGDGEPNGCGRLLNVGIDQWVHINCALWSPEVVESPDGGLVNLDRAVARGAELACDSCDAPGATVGCHHLGCTAKLHFRCAQAAGSSFHVDSRYVILGLCGIDI